MKKSLYVYLSSLLGILLFLILHRLIFFAYLMLASLGFQPFVNEVSSLNFLALELFSLILTLMLGAWYGIWVGMHWYEKVYEEGSHPGLVGHLAINYWPKPRGRYNLVNKIADAQKRLEADMWHLEGLTNTIPAAITSPEPIKRKIVRKRAPRKLTKLT
jgi:hypothetical protein